MRSVLLDIELILYVHVAYFGGKTEEPKQSRGGSEISRVGFAFFLFFHVFIDATYPVLDIHDW